MLFFQFCDFQKRNFVSLPKGSYFIYEKGVIIHINIMMRNRGGGVGKGGNYGDVSRLRKQNKYPWIWSKKGKVHMGCVHKKPIFRKRLNL